MSGSDSYGRSSLSFNAPDGVLDIDEIVHSNPWKDLKTFDCGEAGLVQRVLTEFGDKLTEQTQRKKGSEEEKKKVQLKKKIAVKLREPLTTKLPVNVTARRSRMSVEKVTSKEKMEVNSVIENKAKKVEEKKPVVRKTKSTMKQSERIAKKLKTDVDGEKNGPKVSARRTVGNPVKEDNKITAKKKSKSVENVSAESKIKAAGGLDSSKAAVEKPRKIGGRATVGRVAAKVENSGTEMEKSGVGKKGQSKVKADKENKKPAEKKGGRKTVVADKKTGQAGEKVGQRNKPTSTVKNSGGRSRNSSAGSTAIEAGNNSEKNKNPRPEAILESAEVQEYEEKNRSSLHEPSERPVEFTAEKMAEQGDAREPLDNAGSVRKSADSSELRSEETKKGDLKTESIESMKEQDGKVKEDSFYRYQCGGQELKKEMADISMKKEPIMDTLLQDSALFENSLYETAGLQKSACASSTFLYDSAISSCTQMARGPRISIVARVKPVLNETHPPVELKYKLEMPLDRSQRSENLHPKVMLKAPYKKHEKKAEFSGALDQGKSARNPEEKRRDRTEKQRTRRTYEQRLLDRYERRRIRRARRHKEKAALAIEEFSRQIVKMAKKMGYFAGDIESSSESSSSLSSESYNSSTYSSDCHSDTSYCSCTSCMCDDSYDSDDYTEFSPCSSTDSLSSSYTDSQSDSDSKSDSD